MEVLVDIVRVFVYSKFPIPYEVRRIASTVGVLQG